MPRPKQDYEKKTLNFRSGDFDKLREIFPDHQPSIIVRRLLARFVDKHYDRPVEGAEVNGLRIEE